MLVSRRAAPSIIFAGTHLYTWVKRHCGSKVPWLRRESNVPSQGSNLVAPHALGGGHGDLRCCGVEAFFNAVMRWKNLNMRCCGDLKPYDVRCLWFSRCGVCRWNEIICGAGVSKFGLNLACKPRQSLLIYDKHVPLTLIICNKLSSQSSICFGCQSGRSCFHLFVTWQVTRFPLQGPPIFWNRYRTPPTQLPPESDTCSQDRAPAVNGGTPRKVSEVKEVRGLG